MDGLSQCVRYSWESEGPPVRGLRGGWYVYNPFKYSSSAGQCLVTGTFWENIPDGFGYYVYEPLASKMEAILCTKNYSTALVQGQCWLVLGGLPQTGPGGYYLPFANPADAYCQVHHHKNISLGDLIPDGADATQTCVNASTVQVDDTYDDPAANFDDDDDGDDDDDSHSPYWKTEACYEQYVTFSLFFNATGPRFPLPEPEAGPDVRFTSPTRAMMQNIPNGTTTPANTGVVMLQFESCLGFFNSYFHKLDGEALHCPNTREGSRDLFPVLNVDDSKASR